MNAPSWLMTIAFCQIAALTPVSCAAQETKASAYADAHRESKTDFNGGWSVKWCDRTNQNIDCGGFNITLMQDGEHICGDFGGALINLRQVDEGTIVGTSVGNTAILAVESMRNNSIALVRATLQGDSLHWRAIDEIKRGGNDIDVIASDNVLIRDLKIPSSSEHRMEMGQACRHDSSSYDSSHFSPKGTAVFLERRGDIDGDGDQDMLIVLQQTDASHNRFEPRTLLVLQRNADGELIKVIENSKAIPCQVCGGKYGDPIQEVEILNNGLSFSFWGGAREAWSKEFRFIFSEHDHKWLLSEVKGGATDSFNGNYCKDQLDRNDFGQVYLEEFDYSEFIERFTTCTIQ